MDMIYLVLRMLHNCYIFKNVIIVWRRVYHIVYTRGRYVLVKLTFVWLPFSTHQTEDIQYAILKCALCYEYACGLATAVQQ